MLYVAKEEKRRVAKIVQCRYDVTVIYHIDLVQRSERKGNKQSVIIKVLTQQMWFLQATCISQQSMPPQVKTQLAEVL